MSSLILSASISLLILLLDIKAKCRKPVYKYIAIFFLVAGVGFFFQALQAEASEVRDYQRCLRSKTEGGINVIAKNETPKKTKQQIKKDFIETCWKKAHYHYEEGCKYLKEAEEISLLFPDISDFDKSKLCLVNFIATIAPGDPTYRVIAAALAMGGQYALIVMDEWNKFKSLLLQSKTHFEMEEYYRLTGKYEYDLYMIEKEELQKKQKK